MFEMIYLGSTKIPLRAVKSSNLISHMLQVDPWVYGQFLREKPDTTLVTSMTLGGAGMVMTRFR